jgi:hypothetical protein
VGDVVVTVTEPDPVPVTPTVDPIAVELAHDANDTAQTAVENVTDVAERVEDNMADISEQLDGISERLAKLEAPPKPPDDPDPVPVSDLPLTPNSPEGSVPGNDIPSDSVTTVDAANTSSDVNNDSDNDKSEQRSANDASSDGDAPKERKRDKAPRQKLGWKAKLLGGSGGRR